MKRKWLIGLIASAALAAGAFGLAACGGDTHPHEWSEWTVTKNAENESYKAKRSCTVEGCNTVQTMDIPPLDDTDSYTAEVITPVSCTSDGETKYTYSDGNATIEFTVVLPKGHKYEPEYVWNEAELTVGLTCSACDMEEVSLTEVDYKTDDRIPDCQHEGYTKRIGTVVYDGQTFGDEKILSTSPKTNHNYNVWDSDETLHWKKCYFCDEKKDDSIAEHDYVNNTTGNEVTKHPTATEKGVREIICQCSCAKNFEFDGAESSCETALSNSDKAALYYNDGKYYHLANDTPVYLNFTGLSDGATVINGIDFLYSVGNSDYSPVVTVLNHTDQPVAYYFDSSTGECILRFFPVDKQYVDVKLKASIYVTEESIAVEKEFTFAPTPTLEVPMLYVYSETEFAYEWKNLSSSDTLFVGKEYKIKALGYAVTINGQSVESDGEGIVPFTPTAAGVYTVTATSIYNPKKSYSAKITAKETVDRETLLSGSYEADDYTVTFDAAGAITVSKDGESDITLAYTYTDGVLTTSGSETVCVSVTPTYKLVLTIENNKKLLTKIENVSNAVWTVLGGTSWTKQTVAPEPESTFSSSIDITFTFNADGTGKIIRSRCMYLGAELYGDPTLSTLNFTYTGIASGDGYKLVFTYADSSEYTNAEHAFEIGATDASKKKNVNDFSIVNENSSVSADGATLTLWLLTGAISAKNSSKQAVSFDKATE